MEVSLLGAAGGAPPALLEPMRLAYLWAGVILRLIIGIIPGVGGVAGLALLLPFTFAMDPYSAFAFLLGLGSVTNTGDTIPAVLFGVPGTVAAQATILDGHPHGQEGRGGTGAQRGLSVVAARRRVRCPDARPDHPGPAPGDALPRLARAARLRRARHLDGGGAVRQLAAPRDRRCRLRHHAFDDRRRSADRYAALDARHSLSLRRLAAAADRARPLRAAGLCDLAIRRAAIAGDTKYDVTAGMLRGAKDVLRNWWLVLRCSVLGAAVGAIPAWGPRWSTGSPTATRRGPCAGRPRPSARATSAA